MYKYVLIILSLILTSCGDGIVEIDSKIYEPKIVVRGFLEPNKQVSNISISRNFPLNQKFNQDSLHLENANVILTDLILNKSYKLEYDKTSKTYQKLDLIVEKGKIYKLYVSATIDNKNLEAWSTTKVPDELLEIDTIKSKLKPFIAFDKDETGNYKCFELYWKCSPDNFCFAFNKEPLNTDWSNMMFSYPWDADDKAKQKYGNNWYSLRHITTYIIFNRNKQNEFYYSIEPVLFIYYGLQRLIITTGDINFLDYITQPQEMVDVDGNYFEPKHHINGNGIGVFGSMISDTVEVTLLKRNYEQ